MSILVILIVINAVLIFMFSTPGQESALYEPFSPYADLLASEQTLAAVRNRRLACSEGFSGNLYTSCSFKPDDGVFSRINITINGDQPKGITFEAINNRLRVGDLAALWGKPDTQIPHSAPTLSWLEQDGTIISTLVPSADHLNYLAPVWVVSFTF